MSNQNPENDPDFAQRMHYLGPPGHTPCIRPEWPHEGPCGHNLLECRKDDPTRGPRNVIDHDHGPEQEALEERNIMYYDGPILDFRVVLTGDKEPILEVVGENGIFYQHDDWSTRFRFDRSDLEVGLEMLLRHGAPPPGEHDGPMDVGEGYEEISKKIEQAVEIHTAWTKYMLELDEKKKWYEKTYPDDYGPNAKGK